MLNKSKGIILLMLVVMYGGCTNLQYGSVQIPKENPLKYFEEYDRTMIVKFSYKNSEYQIKSAKIDDEQFRPDVKMYHPSFPVDHGYGYRVYNYIGDVIFQKEDIKKPIRILKEPFYNNFAVLELYKYDPFGEIRLSTFTSEQIMKTAEYGPFSKDSEGFNEEYFEPPPPPITLNMEVQFVNDIYELVYVEILNEPFKPYPYIKDKILRPNGHGVRGLDENGDVLFDYDNKPKPIHAVHAPFSDELYALEFYERGFPTEIHLNTFTIDDIFQFIDFGIPIPTSVNE